MSTHAQDISLCPPCQVDICTPSQVDICTQCQAEETGVDELDQEKLPFLLTNKYQSLEDAQEILGDVANIIQLFIEFQKHLYLRKVA